MESVAAFEGAKQLPDFENSHEEHELHE